MAVHGNQQISADQRSKMIFGKFCYCQEVILDSFCQKYSVVFRHTSVLDIFFERVLSYLKKLKITSVFSIMRLGSKWYFSAVNKYCAKVCDRLF